MTDQASPAQPALPTRLTDDEYARATSERAIAARARGLNAPYIPGGEDPDPATAAAEERRLGKLLIGMVLTIILGGFAISILALIVMSSG